MKIQLSRFLEFAHYIFNYFDTLRFIDKLNWTDIFLMTGAEVNF